MRGCPAHKQAQGPGVSVCEERRRGRELQQAAGSIVQARRGAAGCGRSHLAQRPQLRKEGQGDGGSAHLHCRAQGWSWLSSTLCWQHGMARGGCGNGVRAHAGPPAPPTCVVLQQAGQQARQVVVLENVLVRRKHAAAAGNTGPGASTAAGGAASRRRRRHGCGLLAADGKLAVRGAGQRRCLGALWRRWLLLRGRGDGLPEPQRELRRRLGPGKIQRRQELVDGRRLDCCLPRGAGEEQGRLS